MTTIEERLDQVQPALLQRFQKMIQSGRLSHAFLFAGGQGLYEMALYISQSIYCLEKREGLPCGHCRPCRLIADNQFADVHLVSPINRVIRTDQIKTMMSDFSQAGIEGEHQVFIFEEAELMHPNGANALLKSMEEPTGQQHFFFLSKQPEKMLSTIQSRSQLVYFPVDSSLLQLRLEEQGLLKNKARFLAQLVQGQEQVLEKIGQSWLLETESQVSSWLDSVLAGRPESFIALASVSSLADDRDKQGFMLDMIEMELGQKLAPRERLPFLQSFIKARQAWQANVPLQACLEQFWLVNSETLRNSKSEHR